MTYPTNLEELLADVRAFLSGVPFQSQTATAERDRLIAAITEERGKLAETLEAGDALAECIEFALETHIYEPGEVPPDSGELVALERWKRLRAVADATIAPYDTHRKRLEAEGFRLGSDADHFDVYRRTDGARAWIRYQGGDDRYIVERGSLVGSAAHAAELESLTEPPAPAPFPAPPIDEEPESRVRNHYNCASCGHEWEDEWSCACDDDCPTCGARHMSPVHSEEIEASTDA